MEGEVYPARKQVIIHYLRTVTIFRYIFNEGHLVKPGEPQGPGEVSMGLASNEMPRTQNRGKGKLLNT